MRFLITGAARGIGRGLTRTLLEKGHSVFLLDSNNTELQHTITRAAEWSSSQNTTSDTNSTKFDHAAIDLSDRLQIKSVIPKIEGFFDGKMDVLINNAMVTPHVWNDGATMYDDPDDESVMEQWDAKLAVGLSAPFILSRYCVPLLRRDDNSQAGCIINISSTRAKQAEDNHEAYSAVKAGLLGLTSSMAVTLGHELGIRVNAISPGWIDVENECADADMKGMKVHENVSREDHNWHPAGRVGRVEDITKAVLFLAESEFVTGENIVIDGGVTRKMVYPEE